MGNNGWDKGSTLILTGIMFAFYGIGSMIGDIKKLHDQKKPSYHIVRKRIKNNQEYLVNRNNYFLKINDSTYISKNYYLELQKGQNEKNLLKKLKDLK